MSRLELASILTYGFNFLEQTDLDLKKRRIKLVEHSIKNNIIKILEKKFSDKVKKLEQISEKKGYRIYLLLSSGIDSIYLYHLFLKFNIHFCAVNLNYKDLYKERELIINYINKRKAHNILFLEENIIENILDIEKKLKEIDFIYLSFHPVLFGYVDLYKFIPNNSIVITGDLGDEIFGLPDSDPYFNTYLVFNFEELKYLLRKNYLLDLSEDEFVKEVKNCLGVNNNFLYNEVFIYFNHVTYKLIRNVINKNKKIIYYPFYKNVIPFIDLIYKQKFFSKDKNLLKILSKRIGLTYNSENKKIGFKYPYNFEIISLYKTYIEKNRKFIDNIFNIEYLFNKVLKEEDLKKKRRKLFVVMILTYLFKNNKLGIDIFK